MNKPYINCVQTDRIDDDLDNDFVWFGETVLRVTIKIVNKELKAVSSECEREATIEWMKPFR